MLLPFESKKKKGFTLKRSITFFTCLIYFIVLDAALVSKDMRIKIHDGEEDLGVLQLHNEATACRGSLLSSLLLWHELVIDLVLLAFTCFALKHNWSCCGEWIFSEADVFQGLTWLVKTRAVSQSLPR